MSSQIIESAPKLRVIGRAGAGVDNINVDAATRRGVIAMNTPGGTTISAAEHTPSARSDTNIAGIALGRLEAGENALAI